MKFPNLPILLLFAATPLPASTLLLNLHTTNGSDPGPVAAPYLDLSPGHRAGIVPSGDTAWNNFTTTGGSSSLSYGDGSAATGVSVSFGSEASPNGGSIDFTTQTINTSALTGTGGGTPGQQNLVGDPGSIYGDGNNTDNSAPARTGWLGGGGDTAIGLRIDGLDAGEYIIYATGRNTNSNVESLPMSLHAAAGASSNSFDFSAVGGSTQDNIGYPDTDPAGYNSFVEGENYVSFAVTIGDGDSVFLASDGASAEETRGFLNSVEIAQVPEPSAALLGSLGLLALIRRRR